jgi:hypothetical protein
MREAIVKISLVLLGGLGTFGLNQETLACALCDSEAAKAVQRGQQAAEKLPANLPSNNAAFAARNPGAFNGANANAGNGAVYRNGSTSNGINTTGNLIPGYLDGIGRGSRAPAPSNPEPAATVEESVYGTLDYPIGDSGSEPGEP